VTGVIELGLAMTSRGLAVSGMMCRVGGGMAIEI
jgi:hypothetical protein